MNNNKKVLSMIGFGASLFLAVETGSAIYNYILYLTGQKSDILNDFDAPFGLPGQYYVSFFFLAIFWVGVFFYFKNLNLNEGNKSSSSRNNEKVLFSIGFGALLLLVVKTATVLGRLFLFFPEFQETTSQGTAGLGYTESLFSYVFFVFQLSPPSSFVLGDGITLSITLAIFWVGLFLYFKNLNFLKLSFYKENRVLSSIGFGVLLFIISGVVYEVLMYQFFVKDLKGAPIRIDIAIVYPSGFFLIVLMGFLFKFLYLDERKKIK